MRVDRAAPKAAKGAVLFDHTRSLFVGNLPLDVEVGWDGGVWVGGWGGRCWGWGGGCGRRRRAVLCYLRTGAPGAVPRGSR